MALSDLEMLSTLQSTLHRLCSVLFGIANPPYQQLYISINRLLVFDTEIHCIIKSMMQVLWVIFTNKAINCLLLNW